MYGGIKKKTITCHYCPLPFSLTKHLKPPLPKSCFLILIQFQLSEWLWLKVAVRRERYCSRVGSIVVL
ncbi:hypothetical protein ES319_A08G130800v1 [Gossypium barbadense]|uniref:Uncharacterized protein n=1 Tax=Gossypium barbadense TaxID=3634 RepID=A0A5J5URB3_GOSBA|nr:hypothetical protein ES319_A08G130800v1 [Gossypium barbadense]